VKRHNRVLDQAARIFRRLGYKTKIEPHFYTGTDRTLRKPDLIVHGVGKKTAVIDVTIVSDM
jgi:hypothetical protein